MNYLLTISTLVPLLCLSQGALAHAIESEKKADATPAFDIKTVHAHRTGHLATFHMDVYGEAGSVIPKPIGQLPGAHVASYVWPTDLDPAVAGFDGNSGILALAVTAHPDFDDTPLYDENRDGDPANDGADWHSHWVVLTKEERCGAGLAVRDITPGEALLPPTAPGLPIALDSPGMTPLLSDSRTALTVPIVGEGSESFAFDGVTADLTVNSEGAAPLLCVSKVHDIASGDLSMPGKLSDPKN